MEKIKVKRCFGFYGAKQPVTEIVIGGKPHKKLGCTHLCRDVALCKSCYWGWYFAKKRDKFLNIENFVFEFMKKNKLTK